MDHCVRGELGDCEPQRIVEHGHRHRRDNVLPGHRDRAGGAIEGPLSQHGDLGRLTGVCRGVIASAGAVDRVAGDAQHDQRDVVVALWDREHLLDGESEPLRDSFGSAVDAGRLADKLRHGRLVDPVRCRDIGDPVGVEHDRVTNDEVDDRR